MHYYLHNTDGKLLLQWEDEGGLPQQQAVERRLHAAPGTDLSYVELNGLDLTGADLAGSNLTGAQLIDTKLDRADLSRADLSYANITRCSFKEAHLGVVHWRAVAMHCCDLTDADLGTWPDDACLSRLTHTGNTLYGIKLKIPGIGFGEKGPVVPVVPNIDMKILAHIRAGGNLNMADWHSCGTSHCRAGWAIVLAGDAGLELESQLGPEVAGGLIYGMSRPQPIPDFFGNNADALADIITAASRTSRLSDSEIKAAADFIAYKRQPRQDPAA